MSDAFGYGRCRVCLEHYMLRADGMVRRHKCEGGGKPPLSDVDLLLARASAGQTKRTAMPKIVQIIPSKWREYGDREGIQRTRDLREITGLDEAGAIWCLNFESEGWSHFIDSPTWQKGSDS